MTKKSVTLLSVPVLLLMTAAGNAQEDVAALEEARSQAVAALFDNALDVDARLNALEQIGYPDDDVFDRLLEIATTDAEDERIRLAAMQRYRYDDRYIATVIGIISDEDESDMLASELIYDISRRTTFRQPAEVRQTLQAALRERLDDNRDQVRLAAYRSLVSSHDVVAIDRVAEGVRSGSPPIPLADALELLDVDGPTRHIQTARPFVQNADADAQAQAVRILATDPDNRQTVVDLASNAETSSVVRVNALRALSREDDGYFEYALRLMANREERPDIRYAAMEGGMARLNFHNVPPGLQVQYGRGVDGVARTGGGQVTSAGKDLGAEAKLLLAHLQRYFPTIRRDFANR